MNDTLNLMQSHRSIRRYQDKPISTEQFQTIIDAAKSASSSSFMQCVSIIRITDKTKRDALVALTGNQAYVGTAAEFLVFCIDWHRHQTIVPEGHFGFIEQTLVGAVDAGLMAQNALLAAQSMELGGVFIGGLRNHPKEVCQLFDLPTQVFPLFGLCLGYPDQDPGVKPRLPNDLLVHENAYQPLNQKLLSQYDQTTQDYYRQRLNDPNSERSWCHDIAEKLQKEARPFMQGCLHSQGLAER